MNSDKTKKVKIVKISNPFRRNGKQIIEKSLDGDSIRIKELITDFPVDYTLIFQGKALTKKDWETMSMTDGQTINMIKKIFGGEGGSDAAGKGAGLLVMIGAIATGNVLAVGGVWSTGSYVAYAAVAFLGGYIISRFEPPLKDDERSQQDTYGWQSPRPNLAQGAPVGITFGEARIKSPQVLSMVATGTGTNQYLNFRH